MREGTNTYPDAIKQFKKLEGWSHEYLGALTLLARNDGEEFIVQVNSDNPTDTFYCFDRIDEAKYFFGYLKGNWQQSLE